MSGSSLLSARSLRVALCAAAAAVVVGLVWLAAARPPRSKKRDEDIEDVPCEDVQQTAQTRGHNEASSPTTTRAAGGGGGKKAANANDAPDASQHSKDSSKQRQEGVAPVVPSPDGAVKAEFNLAKQKAFELFKSNPPKYAEAATWFSKAIEHADAHEALASQRVALYNNRSACRERVGDLEASLEDCAAVLQLNPTHAKVRRRRARVFEKMGRHADALIEICADLLIQREDFKRALKEGKTPEQPTPVENVEAVMRAVGREAADAVLREREASKTHEFGMPSSNTVTQLLATYVDYAKRKELAEAEPSDEDLEAELERRTASSTTTSNNKEASFDVIAHRLRRATKWTYTKRYDEAKQEVDRALADFEALRAKKEKNETTGDDDGGQESWEEEEPRRKAVVGDLWRQVGLYRHLAHDLTGAANAYEEALKFETDPKLRAETRVKAAGVKVDAGDAETADAELDKALAEDPTSSDVYMHRAQLHVIKRDLASAQRDLETCIASAPGHVLARLRLATVLIHNQASPRDVERHVAAAERLAPDVSEVYQVRGEILLSRNDLAGAVRQFDKAIALDPTNPVPLYNKGMALIQLDSFQTDRTKALFEAALDVDPTCMVALMRLSELKLQLAATFDQAQDVVDMLDRATKQCRDKDELVELATVKAMAIAQLRAARDIGLTSFQM